MDPGRRDKSAMARRQTLDPHADRLALRAGVGDMYGRQRVALAWLRHSRQADGVLLHANPNARFRALRKNRKDYEGDHAERRNGSYVLKWGK
jgi:hypothetical protein